MDPRESFSCRRRQKARSANDVKRGRAQGACGREVRRGARRIQRAYGTGQRKAPGGCFEVETLGASKPSLTVLASTRLHPPLNAEAPPALFCRHAAGAPRDRRISSRPPAAARISSRPPAASRISLASVHTSLQDAAEPALTSMRNAGGWRRAVGTARSKAHLVILRAEHFGVEGRNRHPDLPPIRDSKPGAVTTYKTPATFSTTQCNK